MSSHITSPYLEKEEPDQYGQTHPIESDRLLNVCTTVKISLEHCTTAQKNSLFFTLDCDHIDCL